MARDTDKEEAPWEMVLFSYGFEDALMRLRFARSFHAAVLAAGFPAVFATSLERVNEMDLSESQRFELAQVRKRSIFSSASSTHFENEARQALQELLSEEDTDTVLGVLRRGFGRDTLPASVARAIVLGCRQ
jgi:hypothetical protein